MSASADDAYETSAGVVQTSLVFLYVIYASGYRWIGVKFNNVNIPKNSVIASATLKLYSYTTKADDPNVTVYGENSANPATYSGLLSNDISNRTRTIASSSYSASNVGLAYINIDVKTIVQELVYLSDWAYGNSINFIIQVNSGSSAYLTAYDAAANHPLCDIEYTAQAPFTPDGADLTMTAGTPTIVAGEPPPSNVTPQGQVDIYNADDDTIIGSSLLDEDGKAVILLSPLPVGVYNFYAYYNGSTKFNPSNTAARTLVIQETIEPPPPPPSDVGEWNFNVVNY